MSRLISAAFVAAVCLSVPSASVEARPSSSSSVNSYSQSSFLANGDQPEGLDFDSALMDQINDEAADQVLAQQIDELEAAEEAGDEDDEEEEFDEGDSVDEDEQQDSYLQSELDAEDSEPDGGDDGDDGEEDDLPTDSSDSFYLADVEMDASAGAAVDDATTGVDPTVELPADPSIDPAADLDPAIVDPTPGAPVDPTNPTSGAAGPTGSAGPVSLHTFGECDIQFGTKVIDLTPFFGLLQVPQLTAAGTACAVAEDAFVKLKETNPGLVNFITSGVSKIGKKVSLVAKTAAGKTKTFFTHLFHRSKTDPKTNPNANPNSKTKPAAILAEEENEEDAALLADLQDWIDFENQYDQQAQIVDQQDATDEDQVEDEEAMYEAEEEEESNEEEDSNEAALVEDAGQYEAEVNSVEAEAESEAIPAPVAAAPAPVAAPATIIVDADSKNAILYTAVAAGVASGIATFVVISLIALCVRQRQYQKRVDELVKVSTQEDLQHV